jgi:hypothetical protein
MRVRQTFLALAVASCGVAIGALPASAGGPLFAILYGANEVTAGGAANQGDLDAVGSATVLIANARKLCFGITVTGTDNPILAHIHSAKAGVVGGIAVVLTPPSAGNPGASSGCVGGLDPAVVKAIAASPGDFYVNVHTSAFPSGAMRGQLF